MSGPAWFLAPDGTARADWPRLWTEACRRFGTRPAVIQDGAVLTYETLDRLSETTADSLRQGTGWRPGRAVALPAVAHSFVVPLLGIWKAGGVAIPTPPTGVSTRDARALQDPIRCLTASGTTVAPDGLGHAIYFTSGSTGTPRAVLRGWRQAFFEAGRYSEILGLTQGLQATMLIEPWFGASTKHFLGCLLSGCLQRFGTEFPDDTDLLHATPAHLPTLARMPDRRTRYRWISLTGEAIPPEAHSALKTLATRDGLVLNALGGTEFGVVLNQIIPAGQARGDLIGQPPPGKTVLVLDEDGTPAATGDSGRMFVESGFLAEGYLDVAPDTGAVTAVPFRSESRPLPRLLTGDVAIAEAGGIRLLGRASAWIKHHGRWLDATPLRQTLDEIRGIRSHHLQAGSSSEGLEVWLEMDSPDVRTLEQVAEQLGRRFEGSPLMPVALHGVPDFPRNRHGKIDLLALRTRTTGATAGCTSITPGPRWMRLATTLLGSDADRTGFPRQGPDLDSLGLENLALELERRTGRPFTAQSLKLTLLADSFPSTFHGDWLRLGHPGAGIHLVWFGDPLLSLRTALPDSVTLWHVEPRSLAGPGLPTTAVPIEDLVTRCLETLAREWRGVDLWIGGYSFGAWMAHEAGRQAIRNRLPVRGVLLVDPPRLRLDPVRRLLRGVRSLGFLMLGRILDAAGRSDSNLARSLRPKLSKEARRGALLRHRPGTTAAATWLFHGDRHGSDTVPMLRELATTMVPVSLKTRAHVAPVQDPALRDSWIRSVVGLIADRGSNSTLAGDPPRNLVPT